MNPHVSKLMCGIYTYVAITFALLENLPRLDAELF